MVKRELVWEVSQDGMSIVPATPQDGGVQGDHNVTRVIFKVAEGSAWADPANAVYIECDDGAGNIDATEQLPVVDGKVSYLLPRAWTQYGGVTTLRLVAEGPGVEGAQAYSPYASVRFESRQNAMHKVDGLMKGRLAHMEQQMTEQMKRAEDAAAGAAESARQANVYREGAQAYVGMAHEAAQQAVDAKIVAGAAASSAANYATAAGNAAIAAGEAASVAGNAASAAGEAAATAELAAERAERAAEQGGGSSTVDEKLDLSSTNPVQNKVVADEIIKMTYKVQKAQGTANEVKNELDLSIKKRIEALEKNGGGGKVIVDVVELPTEDINEMCFYRLLRATLFTNREYACHTVLSLPAVGEPFLSGKNKLTVYHNINDNTPYGYVTSALSSAKGVSEGWHSLDELATPFDYVYGGVVSSTKEVTNTNAVYLFVTTVTYSYDGRLWKPVSDEYNRINVRDYGAVGDGVADDRQAIIAAFNAAKSMLPCEVYFPAGTYGISNGITEEMAYGTGGLLVRGAGRDITTIKYLESYDPDQKGNMWYAIRIWPVGMPDNKPPTDGDYLHDISITGLSVFDPDPCAHAWHPSKGDPNKEETHGFDLQYIKRVSVTDCNLLYVGDEAIDICGCYDVIVMNNHVEGCPAAGTAGGAISIGDGCKGVIVSGNTVNGSAPDETLDDGTVIKKSNFGIAVESLFIPVVDVTITGNVVTNIQGNGINLGATNEGSGLTNIIISNNVINNCCIGIDDEGTHPKQGIKICDNLITNTYLKDGDYGHAIRFNIGLVDVAVTGNTIKNIAGEYAIRAAVGNSTQVYADNLIDGLDNAVYFGSGDVTFKDCIIKNGGRVAQGKMGAIICTAGDLKVANCTLKNVCNTKGVVGATSVENTDIELINTSGTVTTGDYIVDYSTSYRLNRVIGCRLRGRLWIKKDYAVVQGVTIESTSIGNNAITVAANGVVVTGCVIVTNANNAISETSGYDCNIFANNIAKRAIAKTGAHSVSVNNVDLDDMTATA